MRKENEMSMFLMYKGRVVARYEIVEVDPGTAREWLSRNVLNRPISRRHVVRYCRQLERGYWKINPGDPIVFGKDGTLYNGQHRLTAIVETGATVPMVIVRDVDEEVRPVLDKNNTRKVYQELMMFDGKENAKRSLALINGLRLIEEGSADGTSRDEYHEIYKRHREGIAFVEGIALTKRGAIAAVLAAIAYAYPVDPSSVESFAEKYVSGEGLFRGDPALVLREHVATQPPSNRILARALAMKTFHAIMNHIRGKDIYRVSASDEAFLEFKRFHEARGT